MFLFGLLDECSIHPTALVVTAWKAGEFSRAAEVPGAFHSAMPIFMVRCAYEDHGRNSRLALPPGESGGRQAGHFVEAASHRGSEGTVTSKGQRVATRQTLDESVRRPPRPPSRDQTRGAHHRRRV